MRQPLQGPKACSSGTSGLLSARSSCSVTVVRTDEGAFGSVDIASPRRVLLGLNIDAIGITDEVAYLEKELATATRIGADDPMTDTLSAIEP